MDRYELATRTRDYITDYVKFADAKAGAVLTLGLAVAGLLAALSDRILALVRSSSPVLIVLVAIAGILLVVATVMLVVNCVEALAPRITSSRRSLVSFPDIAKDPEWYLTGVAGLEGSNAAAEFEKHASELARIALEKFSHIGNAVWWLRFQVIGSYALVVFYVVARALS